MGWNFASVDRALGREKTAQRQHREVLIAYTLFLIRMPNFGAKAERSYICLWFEAENVKMFLNLHCTVLYH